MGKVTGKGLAKSSLFGIGSELWKILSRLFLTPLIIAKVGLEGYGIWALMFSITAQMGIVNTSFGNAYAKLTAEYDSRQDYKELTHVLSSGMNIIFSFAVVGLTVIVLFGQGILGWLNVPAPSISDAYYGLLIVASTVLLQLSFGCILRALEGLQRMDLVHTMLVLGSMLDFAVTMVLLLMGYGIIGLATGYAVGQVAQLIIGRTLLHRIEPRIGINPFVPTKNGMKAIGKLGGKFQALSLIGMAMNDGTRVLISALLGVEFLGFSEIAGKLLNLGGTVGRSIVSPLMAAFANLHARAEAAARSLDLYHQASRVLSITSGICFSFLALFADQIVFMWTGNEYPLAAWAIRASAFPAALQTLTGPGTASLRGRGSLRLEMTNAIISTTLIFSAAYPFFLLGQFKGLVFAFCLGGTVGPLLFLYRYHRSERISLGSYFAAVATRPAAALVPSVTLTFLMSRYVGLPQIVSSARFQTLFELAIWGLLFAAVVFSLSYRFVLSADEREAVSNRLNQRRAAAA